MHGAMLILSQYYTFCNIYWENYKSIEFIVLWKKYDLLKKLYLVNRTIGT